jgi:hypothetical protein
MKKHLLFTVLIILFSCKGVNKNEIEKQVDEIASVQNDIKYLPLDISKIQNSKWTSTPMQEFPKCIDSLIFKEKVGFSYSCEHEEYLKIDLFQKGDTLYVEKWDFANHLDSTQEISVKEWFRLTDNGLTWVKVLRKRGDNWDELEKKYLNRFFYKRIK